MTPKNINYDILLFMKCLYPTQFTKNGFYNPCGQCKSCRLNRKLEWITKLRFEQKYWQDQVAFVTLTYADDTLPLAGRFKGGTLYKEHVQLFQKRFRKNYYKKYPDTENIRFFSVGEYGGASFRAHYHLIIFGVDPKRAREIVEKSWKVHRDFAKHRAQQRILFPDQYIREDDLIGRTQCDSVRKGGFNYVTGYCMKKLTNPDAFRDRRNPEFSISSRHPAIGHVQIPAIVKKLKEKGIEPNLPIWDTFLMRHDENSQHVINGIFYGILGAKFNYRLDNAFMENLIEYFFPLRKYDNNAYLNNLEYDVARDVSTKGWKAWKVHKEAKISLQQNQTQEWKQHDDYQITKKKGEKIYRQEDQKRHL
jgi:hypothetical protein